MYWLPANTLKMTNQSSKVLQKYKKCWLWHFGCHLSMLQRMRQAHSLTLRLTLVSRRYSYVQAGRSRFLCPGPGSHLWFSQGCRNIYSSANDAGIYICGSAKDVGIYIWFSPGCRNICGSVKDAGICMWFSQLWRNIYNRTVLHSALDVSTSQLSELRDQRKICNSQTEKSKIGLRCGIQTNGTFANCKP